MQASSGLLLYYLTLQSTCWALQTLLGLKQTYLSYYRMSQQFYQPKSSIANSYSSTIACTNSSKLSYIKQNLTILSPIAYLSTLIFTLIIGSQVLNLGALLLNLVGIGSTSLGQEVGVVRRLTITYRAQTSAQRAVISY